MKSVLLVLVLFVLAACAAYLLQRRTGQRLPTAAAVSADPDQEVIDQLRQTGSDLTQPHQFDFYVYLPSREAAIRAEALVQQIGLTTKVERAAKGPQWLCLASDTFIPTKQKIHAVQQRLGKIAGEFGGEYDGWEAEVRHGAT